MIYFSILFFSGLSSVLTKTITQNQNNYDSNNNMHLISLSSQSASIAESIPIENSLFHSVIERKTNGDTIATPAVTNAPKLNQKPKDPINLSITQKLQQQLRNNGISKSKEISSADGFRMGSLPIAAVAAAMVAGPSLGGDAKEHLDHNSLDELYKEPMYFGTENSTTITTQIGANAHLPCTIHHIGEGVVSTNDFI